jgi:hypothetical protein
VRSCFEESVEQLAAAKPGASQPPVEGRSSTDPRCHVAFEEVQRVDARVVDEIDARRPADAERRGDAQRLGPHSRIAAMYPRERMEQAGVVHHDEPRRPANLQVVLRARSMTLAKLSRARAARS